MKRKPVVVPMNMVSHGIRVMGGFAPISTSNGLVCTLDEHLRYRSTIGMTVRGSGPMYSAFGRMMRLSARCSNTCADQPVVRDMTKIGVNSFVGIPKKW